MGRRPQSSLSAHLKLVPDGSHEAAYLLSRYAAVLGLGQGDYEGAQEAIDQALEIARREADTDLEMVALAIASMVEVFHLRLHKAADRGLEAVALEQVDDLYYQGFARFWGGIAPAAMGNPDDARLSLDACLGLWEKLGNRYSTALGLVARGSLSLLEGDWESTRDFIERSLSLAPQETLALGTGAALEFETGDFEAGETYLERMLGIVHLSPPSPSPEYAFASTWVASTARISGVVERLDVTEHAARAVLSSQFATPWMAVLARAGMALIAVQRGDAEAASEQYVALGSQRGMIVLTLANDRILGLLAHTMGKPDEAVAHFEDALAFCRRAGYRPELAWSLCDYADTLLNAQIVGAGFKPALVSSAHREKAMSLLDESLAVSTELGMRPLMERAAALREQAGSQPAKAPEYPDGLSQREVEVLRLVAAGKSNQDIANELFISIHTVVRHVSNIFSKTGSANRTEAATYATRHGLGS